jgi:3-oxoacyl-[acyl-carrier protein] reductase
MKLSGKISIVTGSGAGIGRAMAKALANEGSQVIVVDIDSQGMEETVRQITGSNGKATGMKADITDLNQIQRLVDDTVKTFGKIDILVNNAGGNLGTPAGIENVTEKDFDRVFNLNIKGLFFLCQAVIKHMKAQKSGRIINVSSHSGRYFGWLTGVHYAASKAAVLGLTRQLAKEVGKDGICVNAIAPGITISGPRLERMFQNLPPESQKAVLGMISLGRLGVPEDHASVIAFLASEDARYISGATIDVNGGELMA